jgi:hypothetical protein
MAPRTSKRFHRQRGAAILEFALVVPLLITMLLFSLFFTELIRGELKLQEAARFAAFEMTSYTLTDYGKKDHAGAFSLAAKEVKEEAEERFKDFDSIETNQAFTPFASFDPMKIEIVEDKDEIDLFKSNVGALNSIFGVVSGPLNKILNTWGFNTHGRLMVKVTSAAHPLLLAQHYMDEGSGARFSVDQWGGQDLRNLPITNTLWLVATGWDLPDGANSNATQGKAGRHGDTGGDGADSGLYTQVDRMKFLGLPDAISNNIPGLGGIVDKIGFFCPALFGTFVVDHAYHPGKGVDCNNPKHPAEPGEQDLAHDSEPGIDKGNLHCFDTTPFRDTVAYDSSLYLQMFKARGAHFMGCKNAQADDPTFQSDPDDTDKSTPKENCN